MLRVLIAVLLFANLFCVEAASANCGVMPDEREVIQGPFKTDVVKNGRVSVVPGEGCDIWLVLDKPKSSGENERSVIAVYKEDGGIPEVETVLSERDPPRPRGRFGQRQHNCRLMLAKN